jgi:ligand-binding sensor domain-containing protein
MRYLVSPKRNKALLLFCLMVFLSACQTSDFRQEEISTTTTAAVDESGVTVTQMEIILTPTSQQLQTSIQVVPFESTKWVEYNAHFTDGLAKGMVYKIALAPDGVVWAATTNGVSRFDGDTWTTYARGDELIDAVANVIAVAPNGTVWVGTEKGVSRFNGETWQEYSVADGLAGNYTNAIAFGKDDTVWFGAKEIQDSSGYHLGGITRFDGNTWETYTLKQGLGSNDIYDLYVDDDGVLWAGTRVGLFSFDGQTWQPGISSGRSDQTEDAKIWDLAKSTENALWFLAGNGGIIRFDYEKNLLDDLSPHTAQGIHPMSLAITQDNHVWIGGDAWNTDDHVLLMYDGKTWKAYSGLSFSIVFDIFSAPDNTLWFGTEKGIYKYTPFD